jgi:predicted nucleic acid-binding protein
VASSFNVLPMDGPAFRIWARLMRGEAADMIEDAMTAATALNRGLTVVTRNIADFALFGVPTFDPFAPPR